MHTGKYADLLKEFSISEHIAQMRGTKITQYCFSATHPFTVRRGNNYF